MRIPPDGVPLEEIMREVFTDALVMSNYIQTDAAQLLSISPNRLSRTAKKLGIELPTDIKDWRKRLGRAGGRPRKL